MARVRLLKSTTSSRVHPASGDGDLLVAAFRDWEAQRSRLDAMILEWQGLEDKLSRKARELQIGLADACQGDLPEARAMRDLDRNIRKTQQNLNEQVSEVRNMQGFTLVDAIAKVRLGLEVQGKFDWQKNARELIEEGIDELSLLIKRLPAEPGQTAQKARYDWSSPEGAIGSSQCAGHDESYYRAPDQAPRGNNHDASHVEHPDRSAPENWN